jgi:hypothetical protein
MSEQTTQPITVTGYLARNHAIFLQVANGLCPAESIESAKATYLENLDKIQVVLGNFKRNFCSIQEHYDRVKDAYDNREQVVEFMNFMKSELHDIEHPAVDRLYKFNQEKQGFDVIEVPTDGSSKFVNTKLGDEVYSREFWQDCIQTNYSHSTHSGKVIFDEDIIGAAKNFLVGPCGAWRNKAILAETQNFSSLEALKESILKQAQEKDMILYNVYEDVKREYDQGTFNVISESPLYVWRGAFLDKQ